MKKTGILAGVCALTLALSMTGCGDTSWVLKDGSITIPTGIYNYYQIGGASDLQSMVAANTSSGTSSTKDIWSQSVSGTNAVTWVMNTALDECKNLATVEKLCTDRKLELTADQKKQCESTAESQYTSYKDLLTKNDISQSSLQRIYEGFFRKQLLFNSYYGANGDKAVKDSELSDYYTKNFAHVKQIFIAKVDTSTYAALSKDDLAKAKTKAQTAFDAAKKDPSKFDDFVTKYNEDPGMKQNPTGYVFSKASGSNYDSKFTDLAFSLKDGEVGMAESEMGYFIELKVKLDPTDTKTYTDEIKSTILSEMKSDEFNTLVKDEVSKQKFEQNNTSIDKYSPKKLKLS